MSVPFHHGRPLPREVLEAIAFELVAQSPLGPPHQLLSLLLTSRAVHSALSMDSGTPLYSRICRLKFDVGAVTRRAFAPGLGELNGHLVQMCTMLKFVRRGDISDEAELDAQLLAAYVAMLDNDGKNRAQLQHAGIEALVGRFVRARLNAGMEENDMWPHASSFHSCALWLMWMFTTKESLERETGEEREEIIRLVFPYIACPYRYASAYAAPNHFILPITPDNPVQKQVFHVPTAQGNWPSYVDTEQPPTNIWYFQSNPLFLTPLIVTAAKLLYWARREVNPFFHNPMIPATRAALGEGREGLTQEDLEDFNAHKVAKLPAAVVWDWDEVGGPVVVGEGGVKVKWGEEDSRRWDVDWWRARMCMNVFRKQPSWRMGSVYVRGMLSGLWQGIQFIGDKSSITGLLDAAQRPSTFSEDSIMFGARPLIMRLTEHALVRTPATLDAAPVPAMKPKTFPMNLTPEVEGSEPTLVEYDASLSNAWIPGPIGSFAWAEGGEALDAGVVHDRFAAPPQGEKKPMSTTQLVVSLLDVDVDLPRKNAQDIGGPISKSDAERAENKSFVTVRRYETYAEGRESVHERMVRAKEEGRVCGFTVDAAGRKVPVLHPGCPRCKEREEALKARRERGGAAEQGRGLELYKVEDMFAGVGLGKGEEGGVIDVEFEEEIEMGRRDWVPPSRTTSPSPAVSDGEEDEEEVVEDGDDSDEDDEDDSESDPDFDDGAPGIRDASGKYTTEPIRRSHDPYRVEPCDGGVEDVILTGGMDEQHRMAWGKSIYYGRVRPWDGLIAILRVAFDRDGDPNAFMIYYGYIYGGDTFVGNWRYAMDNATGGPLEPQFECAFLASRRSL